MGLSGFGVVVVMLAALPRGCGGLSARHSDSPSSMLLPGFGLVVVGPPGFSLGKDRCGCVQGIF